MMLTNEPVTLPQNNPIPGQWRGKLLPKDAAILTGLCTENKHRIGFIS
ncbi:hypothetical protein [Vibrio gazogenes]|nr:hypothetical protein [Vibrio gazogenes]USP13799.1 hypothetical protein MKS89_00095 [Vibrio gazogenes]